MTTLRHSAVIAKRSLIGTWRTPEALVDVTLQPIIFLLLFTYVFGGAIAGSTTGYLMFALPGILVQNALFASANMGVALNNDLQKGVFDRLRALPIARWAPLAGRVVADLAKQTWAFALLLGIGLALGFRVHTGLLGVFGALGLLLVFAFAISWAAVLIGVLADEPEKVQVFAFVVMMPLTFTSNAFVATATMPGWLQTWVKVNPVSILADALRGLLVSGPVGAPVTKALLFAAAITAVFAPLAVRALRRRT